MQAGVDQPGRLEKVKLKLPPGIKYEPRPDKSLSGMLVSGEIDAALSAHPPLCFEQGHPNVGRLFEDYLDIEMKYVKETGIYPIMHAVAFRREIVEQQSVGGGQPVQGVRRGAAQQRRARAQQHQLGAAAAVGLRIRAAHAGRSSART